LVLTLALGFGLTVGLVVEEELLVFSLAEERLRPLTFLVGRAVPDPEDVRFMMVRDNFNGENYRLFILRHYNTALQSPRITIYIYIYSEQWTYSLEVRSIDRLVAVFAL